MKPDSILLLAIKCSVLACERETGRRLWQTALKEGWTSSDFVSLVADDLRVYATTKGELFCLDLFTGRVLWQDGLKGMGYGVVSLALPDATAASSSARAEHVARLERERRDSSDTHSRTSS